MFFCRVLVYLDDFTVFMHNMKLFYVEMMSPELWISCQFKILLITFKLLHGLDNIEQSLKIYLYGRAVLKHQQLLLFYFYVHLRIA